MCEPERDRTMDCEGTGVGGFWCPHCGRTTCEGQCVTREIEGNVSIRAKGPVKMTRLEEVSENALDITKGDLTAFLAEYLGDAVFAARFADCIDILRRKNADYSQNEQKGDRIAAFRRIARDADIPLRKVWAVFAQKHWGAIMRYVKEGRVESEPIDGRINDSINYFVLLGAIVDDERRQAEADEEDR